MSKAATRLPIDVREALIALNAVLKAISRDCGNQATLLTAIISEPMARSLRRTAHPDLAQPVLVGRRPSGTLAG